MPRTLLLFVSFLLVASSALAQDRVRERDLTGTWQLQFDVDLADADGPFERIAMKAVVGLLDEIDVRFAFLEDNDLRILVDTFGDQEEEFSDWRITRQGALVLGDTGPIDVEDEETVWLKDDGKLWAYDLNEDGKPQDRKGMYLTRLD